MFHPGHNECNIKKIFEIIMKYLIQDWVQLVCFKSEMFLFKPACRSSKTCTQQAVVPVAVKPNFILL